MRQARLRAPSDSATGFYHCVSRVVDKHIRFDDAEKDYFVQILRESEELSEVQVLTYCVMPDHFHVLVAVPQRPTDPALLPNADQIVAKIERLSGHSSIDRVREQLETFRSQNDTEAEARLVARYHDRMWDVSPFIRLPKQRFTQWFNARHDRRGTLWDSRFKSVVVEGAGLALVKLAAYIDLNAIRGQLVEDPKDYAWCGFGEAVAGRKRARVGVQAIIKGFQGGTEETLERSLELYRSHLYPQCVPMRTTRKKDRKPTIGGYSKDNSLRLLAAKEKLSWDAYLRCRVRYFTDGAVYGSKEFVEKMFQKERGRYGVKRKTGARALKGVDGEVFALRALQKRVFG
jgi:putative transposase